MSLFPFYNDKFIRSGIANPGDLSARDSYCSFYFLFISPFPCLLQLQKRTGIALLAISWCLEHARGPSGWFLGRGTHLTARIQRLFRCWMLRFWLIYTRAYIHTRLTLLVRCLDLLFRLVRQKAMHAIDIPENVVWYPSRLVPYHIAIKMEVYLFKTYVYRLQIANTGRVNTWANFSHVYPQF